MEQIGHVHHLLGQPEESHKASELTTSAAPVQVREEAHGQQIGVGNPEKAEEAVHLTVEGQDHGGPVTQGGIQDTTQGPTKAGNDAHDQVHVEKKESPSVLHKSYQDLPQPEVNEVKKKVSKLEKHQGAHLLHGDHSQRVSVQSRQTA